MRGAGECAQGGSGRQRGRGGGAGERGAAAGRRARPGSSRLAAVLRRPPRSPAGLQPRAWYAAAGAAPNVCPRRAAPQRATIRRLDDSVFAAHHEGALATGGTTLIVHVLTATHVYTANVGDCKSVLSSRGACVELNTCHNPIVPSERERFQVRQTGAALRGRRRRSGRTSCAARAAGRLWPSPSAPASSALPLAGGGHLLLRRPHRRLRHQRVPHSGRLRPRPAAQGPRRRGRAARAAHLGCGSGGGSAACLSPPPPCAVCPCAACAAAVRHAHTACAPRARARPHASPLRPPHPPCRRARGVQRRAG